MLRLCHGVAALYLLATAGPAPALVYCVGDDGHREIESVLSQRCCEPAAPSATSAIDDAEHCDCVDTPLALQAAVQTRTDELSAPVMQQVLTIVVPASASRNTGRSAGVPIVSRQPPPASLVLRSVVLRI